MAPILTVLMPGYNEAGTVAQAIDQVLETDLGVEIELVVVDDGSTDGTAQILSSGAWPDRVTVLRHERNQGKGAAVRRGQGMAALAAYREARRLRPGAAVFEASPEDALREALEERLGR